MNEQKISIHAILALKDNYIWIIETQAGAIIIDPGDAKPVIKYLTENQLKCIGILITHHHLDHIGGVDDLYLYDPKIQIYGPDNLNLKSPVKNPSKKIEIAGITFNIIAIPGHTLDHIAYYNGQHLFIGDTLFSAGCGRVFEGTHAQMLESLDIISKLPDETIVYCAHEYTLNNLRFAKIVEPDNLDIDQHIYWASNQSITLPSTLAKEKRINPFLRLNQPTIHKNIQKNCSNLSSRLAVFSTLRNLKDEF